MTVIAMTREMGSLGKDVAQGVAQALGLDIVHHELVESHVSRRMGIDPTAVHRFLEGTPGLVERFWVDGKSLLVYTAEELFELAEKGNVIIRGWGASYLLRDVPHVLCLRVCAPLPFRVETMMKRLEMKDAAVAEREIRTNDAAHDRLMKQHFGVDWRDPLLYDMVLNSAGVPVEQSVALVRKAVSLPAFTATAESRAVLTRARLRAQLRAALTADPRTTDYEHSMNIVLDSDAVVLRGLVRDRRMRRAAEDIVGAVPGVHRVLDELLVENELPLRS